MTTPDPAGFLPLHVKDTHLLLSLSRQPLHGYAVVKDVEERTEGRVRIEPANLYRRIHRWVEEGVLTETDPPPAEEGVDDRRRYYTLTPLGRRVLSAELDRMAALLAQAGRAPAMGSGGDE